MNSLTSGTAYLKDILAAVMTSSMMEECSLLVVQSKRSLTQKFLNKTISKKKMEIITSGFRLMIEAS